MPESHRPVPLVLTGRQHPERCCWQCRSGPLQLLSWGLCWPPAWLPAVQGWMTSHYRFAWWSNAPGVGRTGFLQGVWGCRQAMPTWEPPPGSLLASAAAKISVLAQGNLKQTSCCQHHLPESSPESSSAPQLLGLPSAWQSQQLVSGSGWHLRLCNTGNGPCNQGSLQGETSI